MKDRKVYERRIKALQDKAEPYLTTWKDIKTYINPLRGSFGEERQDGKTINHKIMLNNHPRQCARVLGSGMTGGMTTEANPWFKMGMDDLDLMEFESVRLWLDALQAMMSSVFSRSNIYSVLGQVYEETGSFGSGAVMILDDPMTIIRGRSFTAGEYWIGRDSSGKPNAFGRRYWMTIGQLIETFGIENLSPLAKAAYETKKDIDKWIAVIHLIEENDERVPDKSNFENMPYRSIQWEEGSPQENILRMGGYEEFPVLAPRWQSIISSSPYGNGPGEDALGNAKMLQKMVRKKLLGLDKMVDPPIQKDGLVIGQVNTLPGGITSMSASVPNAGVRPTYQVNLNFGDIDNSIKTVEDSISKTFYMDLFLMLLNMDRKQVTAYEIAKKIQEKEFLLGSVLQSFEDELLDPLIDRTFMIALRHGIVPEIPPEVRGHNIKTEYISILAQARKMIGTAGVEQVCSFAANLSQVKADVIDKIDYDEALNIYSRMVGTPEKLLSSDEFVKSIRLAREEARKAEQGIVEAQAAVQGVKDLAGIEAGAVV